MKVEADQDRATFLVCYVRAGAGNREKKKKERSKPTVNVHVVYVCMYVCE